MLYSNNTLELIHNLQVKTLNWINTRYTYVYMTNKYVYIGEILSIHAINSCGLGNRLYVCMSRWVSVSCSSGCSCSCICNVLWYSLSISFHFSFVHNWTATTGNRQPANTRPKTEIARTASIQCRIDDTSHAIPKYSIAYHTTHTAILAKTDET